MVQLEELIPENTTAEPSVTANDDEEKQKSKNALQDCIVRRSRGSSYYYAHEQQNTGRDIPAPSPPEGGTRLPTTTTTTSLTKKSTADVDEARAPHQQPQKQLKQSPYYYSEPKVVSTEAPAPMPPEGGTLLARGAPMIDEEREEPLQKYYFEDDGAWVKVTFPLEGIGRLMRKEKEKNGDHQQRGQDENGSGAEAAADAPTPVVTVVFGEKSKRSFEVTVRNYRSPPPAAEAATDAATEGRQYKKSSSSNPPVLKFRCHKAHGDVILSKCDWKVRADKIVVRLFKDPSGVNKYRPWRKVM